ncbi:Thiol-activated cytolysin [Saccharicrinis carchari]|uniref:Thiol-activated cytolysin n=1 Tax=Saccharicrinis carchari TaxID=1168039 RepID=A0A521F8W7_SACCC|nr:thiol-activated cytolysin family protein [Saccharicrinis carchari]SMO92607.1 Thiol-activated cytolysin [Saccharicrinis carchari]
MKKNTPTPRFKGEKYSVQKSNYFYLSFMFFIISIAMGSCKKDNGPSPDIGQETDDYILSLPPVQFEAEKPATIDSTATEQDLEYDYTIDYYSAAAGYDEQIVLNPQTDVIYPGALIKGETILDGSYVPISVKRKPITISTSLQGAGKVSVKVEDPKLSTVREAVNDLMSQEYDVPPANMGFTVENIYSREQFKMAVRASYSSGAMDVNGSFNYSNTKIKSRVVAKFIQNYYTLDMDLPAKPSDLIDEEPSPNIFGSLMPMYISTVTFGRMALFTVESELSETEVNTYLQASYSQIEGESSTDFEKLVAKSTMKVYVLGGSGADAGTAINGFSDFKKYITRGGNFSKTSPGAPISYKLRYIHDNTIARTVFSASYPVRTAVPRTDNLRYDISVRLYRMTPHFEDGNGSPNELFGTIKSWRTSSKKYNHWSVSSSGTYLKLGKNKTHTFSNNTTTRRRYNNLVSSHSITIQLSVKEQDAWPDADEDLGTSSYTVPLIDIIAKSPASLTYTIKNYGQGSSFMDVVFILKVEKITRI